MNLTWDGLAHKYSLRRCQNCPAGDHIKGSINQSTWTIHWTDRRMTRAGLRRYLMLVSECVLMDVQKMPEWRRLYVTNRWAGEQALNMGVRLPAWLSDTDRARVRWLITKAAHVPPEIQRWADRRITT